MTTPILLIASILVVAIGLLLYPAIAAVRAYRLFRGKRLVTCPETHKPAAVEVDATKAMAWRLGATSTLRLDQCSRWPERRNCGQECLRQVEADPENCLVWNIVANWYEGRHCVYCRKPFGLMKHLDHPPALQGPKGQTSEWSQLRPEQLPAVFSTHLPVCWNCHVVATFRRLYPELVVERH